MGGRKKTKDARIDSPAVDPEITGRVTINDIARMAEVSKKTVSRIINKSALVSDDTRKRVEAIIEKTGFEPDPQARALAFRKSFLIGLAYDNPSPQYVVNMQRGILDQLWTTDYQLVLHPVDRTTTTYQDAIKKFVMRHRPAGIIMPPSVSEDEEIAELLQKLNCQYVRIASVELDEPSQMVRTQDADGAAQAARHLAQLGHKRIAHIHGPSSFRSAHERLAGFRAGLAEFGIELSDELTLEAGYTFDSGVRAADNLLSKPKRPTAIFAGNDEMAIGAYTSARKAGLSVPDDVSIVGFDDTPMAARIWPQMTTVRLPIREMGQAAAERLLEQLSGTSTTTTKQFSPELVVRQSTTRISR